MTYKLLCNSCGASCWCRGDYDPSVNAFERDESKALEWEGGFEGCDHEDYDVVDEAALDEAD